MKVKRECQKAEAEAKIKMAQQAAADAKARAKKLAEQKACEAADQQKKADEAAAEKAKCDEHSKAHAELAAAKNRLAAAEKNIETVKGKCGKDDHHH